MEKECKHIFSYEEGFDGEAWLNYEPKHPDNLHLDWDDVLFKYCPLCGEELALELK